MPFLLRLPDALDAQVRDKAQSLGISINALLCVAADAYLRGGILVTPEPAAAASPLVAQAVAPVGPVAPSKAERREITRQKRLHRR